MRPSRALVARLMAWYDAEKRDLPWRQGHARDPYAILVCEFMLQQTQVVTALPYYERFLKRFPTVEALARAEEQEVLLLWSGLGYYSRARHLHQAARQIVERHGGRLPADVDALRRLPGVGPYMAGAVASIAFGLPEPAVDANVARAMCRWFALPLMPNRPAHGRVIDRLVRRLLPPDRPGDFNQALMDLGARICPARGPRCDVCPVAPHCRAWRRGNPEDYPCAKPKVAIEEVEEATALVRCADGPSGDHRFLVCRAEGAKGRYRNMWEFPTWPLDGCEMDNPRRLLADRLFGRFGIAVDGGSQWLEIRHQVTRFRIRKRVYCFSRCSQVSDRVGTDSGDGGLFWVDVEGLSRLPLGAPHKKIVRYLMDAAHSPLFCTGDEK